MSDDTLVGAARASARTSLTFLSWVHLEEAGSDGPSGSDTPFRTQTLLLSTQGLFQAAKSPDVYFKVHGCVLGAEKRLKGVICPE